MPNPENESIPYLKGMLTLSILMLIYVYGQADIKNTLTIALIGLEIKNPDILGQMIFIALTWYTIRFWRTARVRNVWVYKSDTQKIIDKLLSAQGLRNTCLYFFRKAPSRTIKGVVPNVNFKVRKHNRRLSSLAVTGAFYEAQDLENGLPTIKIPIWFSLLLEACAFIKWIFDESNFSSNYVPFFIAIFALISGLTAAGYNPFSEFIK